MVLIIRNNRIQSRRHYKIKNFFSYVVPKDKKTLVTEKEKESSFTMSKIVEVLGTFFLYSLAMFTLPFLAFFGVRHVMITKFDAETFVTNSVSVFASVIVVNIIIGVYAYKALHEPEEQSEPLKPADNSVLTSDSTEETNKKTD